MSLFARLDELYIERDYIQAMWYSRCILSEFRIYNWHCMSIIYSKILVILKILKSRYPMHRGLDESISNYKAKRHIVHVLKILSQRVLNTRLRQTVLHIMQEEGVFNGIELIHNYIISFLALDNNYRY